MKSVKMAVVNKPENRMLLHALRANKIRAYDLHPGRLLFAISALHEEKYNATPIKSCSSKKETAQKLRKARIMNGTWKHSSSKSKSIQHANAQNRLGTGGPATRDSFKKTYATMIAL